MHDLKNSSENEQGMKMSQPNQFSTFVPTKKQYNLTKKYIYQQLSSYLNPIQFWWIDDKKT